VHSHLRFWLIVAFGATAGIVVSFGLAEEVYALAAVIVAMVAWLALSWFHGARPEARLLAAVIVGYILGSRGFAQLLVAPQLPLLPAEIALLVVGAMTLYRMVRRETGVIWRDGLNVSILAWMALGAARLWPDVRTHGIVALRDFATIYYAAFFFLAQGMAQHEASARLLRRATLGALVALPFAYMVFSQFSDFFLSKLVFRGVPLVYYKEDLVAANLFAGFFLLMTMTSWSLLWRSGLALAAYGLAFTINSSRAAIVGLLVTAGWWIAARRWMPLKLQATAIPLGLVALGLAAVVQPRDFHESRLYTLYEHVASMVDFSGTRRYSTEDRRYVGDNNRFRLAWWRAVADETRETNLAFGLGFGADLTSRFLRTYELDLGDEFSTRSPHSIVMTVFGRMGVAGLAAFLSIVAFMAFGTLRLARRARTDDAALVPLGWWSVGWITLTSACFGVVLEGPMGAVLFWTSLGLASATTRDLLATPAESAATTERPIQPAALPEVAAL
jgi:hypothetical protein